MWLFLAFVGLWLVENIPGSHDSFYQLENPQHPSQAVVEETTRLPLFYFSWFSDQLAMENTSWKKYLPHFSWNGRQCLFHRQLLLWVSGNFGNSYRDNRPVSQIIAERLPWTLALQIPAILIILFLAIRFAVWEVKKSHSLIATYVSNLFMAMHSIPGFWLASILLLFFASPDFLNWFPSNATDVSTSNLFVIWSQYPEYLVLPILSIVLPSLSYINRLIRNGLLDAMAKPFWKRAVSTGIAKNRIIQREALPMAMLPLMAWIAGILPWMFSGSLIVENIFSIPGIGRLMYQSIVMRDWPVSLGIFMIVSAATILGILLADLLMFRMDPRTRKIL